MNDFARAQRAAQRLRQLTGRDVGVWDARSYDPLRDGPIPKVAPVWSTSTGATVSPPTEAEAKEEEPLLTMSEIRKVLTPAIVLTGIVTGAAFAVGSGLVSHYVFKKR